MKAKVEGRTLADVLKEVRTTETNGHYPTLEDIVRTYSNVQTVYKYTNPETRLVDLAVIRYQPNGHKKFAQCSPNGKGWLKARPEGLLPLYNRSRLRRADSVIVVEGEKAVHALADIDMVATTSPMGAGKAGLADWTPLTGKKVYLWPDNDDPGIAHMRDVEKILDKLECQLHWVNPDLPAKGDAADFLELNGGLRSDKKIAVSLLLDEATPLGAARELGNRIQQIISGEWSNIEFPWPMVSTESQALLPDSILAICGEPGAAKSFWMLEAFSQWHLNGEKVALFMLEDDRTYHLNRVMAQLDDNSLLTEARWVQAEGQKAKDAFERHRDKLDSFGRVLYDAPDRQVTLSELADWFEARCQEGFKICGIDPITAAQANNDPWIQDQKFIFRAKEIAKKYHSRLIYVIHPRIAQGKMGASLSRMAGGAAYSRFSHSVFWLTFHESPKTTKVYSETMGTRLVTYERSIKIAKARNGRGAGSEIAFHFQPETLRFEEYGVVNEN